MCLKVLFEKQILTLYYALWAFDCLGHMFYCLMQQYTGRRADDPPGRTETSGRKKTRCFLSTVWFSRFSRF